jgi:hypothetical protein
MTSPLLPSLRSLLVCEDVLTDTSKPPRFTLVNLLTSIRAMGKPPYPFEHPRFYVFAQLTECRGQGVMRVEIREADEAARAILTTPPQTVAFPNNPLSVYSLRLRILRCLFPRPGLYWVQFFYDDRLLGQQPIVLC